MELQDFNLENTHTPKSLFKKKRNRKAVKLFGTDQPVRKRSFVDDRISEIKKELKKSA